MKKILGLGILLGTLALPAFADRQDHLEAMFTLKKGDLDNITLGGLKTELRQVQELQKNAGSSPEAMDKVRVAAHKALTRVLVYGNRVIWKKAEELVSDPNQDPVACALVGPGTLAMRALQLIQTELKSQEIQKQMGRKELLHHIACLQSSSDRKAEEDLSGAVDHLDRSIDQLQDISNEKPAKH